MVVEKVANGDRTAGQVVTGACVNVVKSRQDKDRLVCVYRPGTTLKSLRTASGAWAVDVRRRLASRLRESGRRAVVVVASAAETRGECVGDGRVC